MKQLTFLIISALLFIGQNLYAQQSGKISGIVVDAQSGETLIGVNVVIDGTLRGNATDFDGKYTIDKLEPGLYTLKFSYITYATKFVTGVEVKAGETTTIDVGLEMEASELGEVVVTAEAILNNEAGLLRQRQKSIAFTDAISSEAISRSGGGDAAAAMRKVVGASVVDGKYVYIRGLGDRYTTSHLNGTELPSADPNRKAFQMDIFPSNLLENIITLKTFTPDKPGNFSGGLVNVQTKEFPENFTLQLSASTGWNSEVETSDIFLGRRSGTDFRASDNGLRDLPDAVREFLKNPDNLIPRATTAERDAEEAALLDRLARSFSGEFLPASRSSSLNQSYSVSLGNQLKLFGKDLGYIASFSYSQAFSAFNDGQAGRFAQIGSSSQTDELQSLFDFRDQKGTQTNDWGGLINVAYKLSPNHKLMGTYVRTQSASNTGRVLTGFSDELPQTAFLQNTVIEFVERSITSYQAGGKHFFPAARNAVVEWKTTFSQNTQDEPDRRQVPIQFDERVIGGRDTTLFGFPNGFAFPSRFFRDLEEDNYTASVDISVPFSSFNRVRGNFKFGGSILSGNRDFNEELFDFIVGSPNAINLNQFNGDFDMFFSQQGIIGERTNGRPIFGVIPRRISDLRNSYRGEKDISAVYGMLELPITDRFKVIGGARLEQATIDIASLDTTVAGGKLDDLDILPAANAIYSLKENMNLRASFSKTLARPNYRELAPFASAEFTNGGIERGNPELERTLIQNYDLRWEWFPGMGEVIAVSGFYKYFDKPIETVIEVEFGNGDFTYKNVPSATVFGLEFEIKKTLGFLTDGLRHFSLSTNLTLVDSEVDIPEEEMIVIRQTEPDASSKRKLQGQSDYIINLDLSYDNPEAGLRASLNYNTFGDRLSKVAAGATPDIFERSFDTLDFLASKNLGRHVEVSMSAKNLIDPKIQRTQRFEGIDFINSSFRKGQTFTLGVKYKF